MNISIQNKVKDSYLDRYTKYKFLYKSTLIDGKNNFKQFCINLVINRFIIQFRGRKRKIK